MGECLLYSKFPPGEYLLYSKVTGGKAYYIANIPRRNGKHSGGRFAMRKVYYTTSGTIIVVYTITMSKSNSEIKIKIKIYKYKAEDYKTDVLEVHAFVIIVE
jgi:hypothetical protein